MRQRKTDYLSIRIDEETRAAFFAKAGRFGTPSDILRELITAFIEDRLTLRPPVKHERESLYDAFGD